MVYYFLFITLKKFQPCVFILKAFKDICSNLKLWISEFVVSFFWCHEQVNRYLLECMGRYLTFTYDLLTYSAALLSDHSDGRLIWAFYNILFRYSTHVLCCFLFYLSPDSYSCAEKSSKYTAEYFLPSFW